MAADLVQTATGAWATSNGSTRLSGSEARVRNGGAMGSLYPATASSSVLARLDGHPGLCAVRRQGLATGQQRTVVLAVWGQAPEAAAQEYRYFPARRYTDLTTTALHCTGGLLGTEHTLLLLLRVWSTGLKATADCSELAAILSYPDHVSSSHQDRTSAGAPNQSASTEYEYSHLVSLSQLFWSSSLPNCGLLLNKLVRVSVSSTPAASSPLYEVFS
ncbi:hypothetical protein TgHK011_007907 [Trichoderma gracile]|nr:hypothetical protein TgHK011_007907 [Trichoderma gracile]